MKLSASLRWFVLVGLAAALTHMLVFAVVQHQIRPELANALGFVVAFGVSFTGHRRLSFKDQHAGWGQSLRRFGLTALLGFASNEILFVALLRGLHWPAFWALTGALILAAGQTFVLSRHWAFRR